MHSDLNLKIITLLFLLSIATFLSHRIGLMDTSFPILIKTKDIPRQLITSDGTEAYFEESPGIALHCHLTKLAKYNFCGVGIQLSEQDITHGLDLRKFNKLALSLHYKAPVDTSKLKVTFRNYNDSYSHIEDPVSLKFNSITYNPNVRKSRVEIPFKALQVDNWWVEQYNIDFSHSQVELSNVSFIEILTNGINTLGNYDIEIKSIILYGQLISEASLLKLILVIWLIIIICFITLQRNKLKRLSLTDTLTGLYNRQGISIWTDKKISSLIKQPKLHMFYLDLDDFKKVNDTYGHRIGDHVLIAFSNHIQNYLNSIPYLTYAFARLAGDEFGLVIIDLKKSQVSDLAENLLNVLDVPISLEKHETYIHASLGISELKEGVKTFEDLLARADSAMYYAKNTGKNHYKIFDKIVSQEIFFHKQIAEKIKDTIIQDNFHLNFMPIFDAKNLDMARVEVLLRTKSDALKGIGPDIFIPIAEEYNLIKDIDLWVIEATFKQITKENAFLSHIPLVFCINISAAELHNSSFVEQLKKLLNLYHINPKRIELEITETSLIETDKMSISTLKNINDLGIKLSLDDFGTGYTAFSQLINYPVDSLKIDKSFIDNLDPTGNKQVTMIKAILSIAGSYQLKTIGEGVEEREQYEFLVAHGCDMIQGYLFAKPMSWNDLKQSIHHPTGELRAAKAKIQSTKVKSMITL